jgi:hypothetical protein
MAKSLNFSLFISLLILCKSELQAQYLLFNPTDTFYFFKEYSYHLNLKKKDSSLLYLKLDLKTTDIEKISSQPYNGSFEYAQFFIDKKKSQIRVGLYNKAKQKIKSELYSFNPIIIRTKEVYFLNLAGIERKLSWNTIETTLLKW